MQSEFPGANWGFLVTLFKREMTRKKRLYCNFECTTLKPNPHQTIFASQKTPQKRMGTRVVWGFSSENVCQPESRSIYKSQANPAHTLKSLEQVKSVGLPADKGVTCWFSCLSLLFGKWQRLPTPQAVTDLQFKVCVVITVFGWLRTARCIMKATFGIRLLKHDPPSPGSYLA